MMTIFPAALISRLSFHLPHALIKHELIEDFVCHFRHTRLLCASLSPAEVIALEHAIRASPPTIQILYFFTITHSLNFSASVIIITVNLVIPALICWYFRSKKAFSLPFVPSGFIAGCFTPTLRCHYFDDAKKTACHWYDARWLLPGAVYMGYCIHARLRIFHFAAVRKVK